MTVTLRFQTTGLVPGDGAPVVMRGPSLTIGRGKGNDMVLPDPDRMVSTTHAVIENHNGNVVVVDLSTNGTFLNYGKIPLGKTPTPLNSGDVLTMGPYELVVEIAKASRQHRRSAGRRSRSAIGDAGRGALAYELLDAAGPGGDFLDDLLGADTPDRAEAVQGRARRSVRPAAAPLGDEDDPFFGPKDPLWEGPAQADHSRRPAMCSVPTAAQRTVIPDDWDDMLDVGPGAGTEAASAESGYQPQPRYASPIPSLRGRARSRSAGAAAGAGTAAPGDDDPFGEDDDAPAARRDAAAAASGRAPSHPGRRRVRRI